MTSARRTTSLTVAIADRQALRQENREHVRSGMARALEVALVGGKTAAYGLRPGCARHGGPQWDICMWLYLDIEVGGGR